MPIQYLPPAALMLAAVAAGFAFYHWRRAANLYSLLVEGANRYEELRQNGAALEQASRRLEQQLGQEKDAIRRLNLSLDEAREQTASLTAKIQQKEHEIRVVTEKLELQKGHLEKQLAKVSEQLSSVEQQRAAAEEGINELRTELSQVKRKAQEDKSSLNQELSLRDRDWQARLYEVEKAKASAEKLAKNGDPAEVRKLRRKIAQYDRLYHSMKGLREMSDERNRNWEIALRKLSAWILEEKGTANIPSAIGPLVGSAMEAIGAILVDEINTDHRHGAEAVTSEAHALVEQDEPEVESHR